MYMYQIPGAIKELITQQEAILQGIEAIKEPVDKGGPLFTAQTKKLLAKLKRRIDEVSKKLTEIDTSFKQEEPPTKKRKIEKVLSDDLLAKLGVI